MYFTIFTSINISTNILFDNFSSHIIINIKNAKIKIINQNEVFLLKFKKDYHVIIPLLLESHFLII